MSKASMIDPAGENVLRVLLRYHYLTSRQTCRLLYRKGSWTHVQTKLKLLSEAGFVQRLFLPRQTQHGSAPSIYTLSRKGFKFLNSLGLDAELRYRPCEQREHGYLYLAHMQALNDVLITLELFCRLDSRVSLHRLQHERILKRDPVYVQDGEGRRLAVIPDAWLDLRLNESEQMCVSLEIDRGTEEQKSWRRKVRGIVAWAKGPYQEKFGTSSLTVAVVATPGEKRLQELLRWTEVELRDAGNSEADLFRLTGQPIQPADPADFFLLPCWYRPFEHQAVPLIDGVR